MYRAGDCRGLTLVELLLVTAIMTILMLVAVPNFGYFVAASRLDGARDTLRGMLVLARSEAVRRGESVAFCPRDPSNENRCGDDWRDGWAVIGSGGAIRLHNAVAGGISLSGDPVTFEGSGATDADAGIELRLADRSADTRNKLLCVNRATGRLSFMDSSVKEECP